MSEICTTFGLPQELCVCESIAKEHQIITISNIKKKFDKTYTVIKGIDEKSIDIKDVAKKLKNHFACGGTSKDCIVELQGDHKQKTKEFLVELGFSPASIQIR